MDKEIVRVVDKGEREKWTWRRRGKKIQEGIGRRRSRNRKREIKDNEGKKRGEVEEDDERREK